MTGEGPAGWPSRLNLPLTGSWNKEWVLAETAVAGGREEIVQGCVWKAFKKAKQICFMCALALDAATDFIFNAGPLQGAFALHSSRQAGLFPV